MDVAKLEVDRKKALELYRAYRTHQHYSKPIDQEIQRTYKLIAQGRVVIRALESIKAAGVREDNRLPKLAIANATATECFLDYHHSGSMVMAGKQWYNAKDKTNVFRWPSASMPTWAPDDKRMNWRVSGKAVVPLIPIHLRPKRALGNYHILWEAEWTRIPPVDPMLLRRIGGDMWLVVAAWDLTEVERAAMATRLSS